MIKFLIDQGAKIDQKNKYGFLAYDYAVHGGNVYNCQNSQNSLNCESLNFF